MLLGELSDFIVCFDVLDIHIGKLKYLVTDLFIYLFVYCLLCRHRSKEGELLFNVFGIPIKIMNICMIKSFFKFH